MAKPTPLPPPITLRARIDELMAEHGSLRNAARALKLQPSYLSRLRNGHQTNPSPAALQKLGLTRRIIYRRTLPNERTP